MSPGRQPNLDPAGCAAILVLAAVLGLIFGAIVVAVFMIFDL